MKPNPAMERVAWSAVIRPGRKADYVTMHNEFFWPEMRALLDEAGIRNQSIWCAGDRLFGYYEAEFGLAHARKVQFASDIFAKWRDCMRELVAFDLDPSTGAATVLERVFLYEGKPSKPSV